MTTGCHNLYKNKTTLIVFLPPIPAPSHITCSQKYDETRVIRIQSNEVVDGGFVAHQIDLFQDSLGRWTSVAKILRKKGTTKALITYCN